MYYTCRSEIVTYTSFGLRVWQTNEWGQAKFYALISSLCSCSPSSAAVCCSCSAPGSPGCSAASKSARLLRSSAPSDRSSWPGRVAPITDPRRRWPSAPHPSSLSSPAMTSTTWMSPPKRGIPQRLMSFKWGRCDRHKLDFFLPPTQFALGTNVQFQTKMILSELPGSIGWQSNMYTDYFFSLIVTFIDMYYFSVTFNYYLIYLYFLLPSFIFLNLL